MFLRLFTDLRAAKVPVTLREYLALLEGVVLRPSRTEMQSPEAE